MKTIGLLGLATFAFVAIPATAQHVVTRTHTTVVHSETHRGPVLHRRKVCTVKWYHHKKVRRCSWR